ncbi:MAG: iron ABC transporter permease [Actinomycetota bacterium]|nr:iron ABC transporter permease [Actinomycetota bacterium]
MSDAGVAAVRRYGLAGLIFLVVIVAAVMIGPSGPPAWRVPMALLDRLPLVDISAGVSDSQWAVVWEIRMPRVILGALVGSMLAVAGASYQGVFRNPLVDPYLLGAAAGAGLGATIVLTVARSQTSTWPIDPVPTVAFIGAIVTVFATYAVGAAFGRTSSVTLVLAGIAVVSMVTAVQTFILQRHSDVVREVYSWILGRLHTATWGDVRLVAPYVVVSVIVLMLHRRHLDLLRVGEDEAQALGGSVAHVRLVVVVAATLGTAAVVSVSGLIGFVGVVVPHVVRMVTGSSYRSVIPLSVLYGGAFLVLADIPGRILTDPAETPIGVVTALLGGPFFVYVLRTRQIAT